MRKEAGGIAVTVLGVQKMNQIDQFLKPDAGNTYLVIEVLIENVSHDEAPYNPLYFEAKDNDGYAYNSALLAPNPDLQSGTLARGEKARGFVAFEVKQSAVGLKVSYEPLVIMGGYKKITINLGQ